MKGIGTIDEVFFIPRCLLRAVRSNRRFPPSRYHTDLGWNRRMSSTKYASGNAPYASRNAPIR